MTWKRIAGRECGDGEGRGHKVRRWNNLIVNFNAEPEDEIDEEYSMMDAEDPPADKDDTRISMRNTESNASPRQSRKN